MCLTPFYRRNIAGVWEELPCGKCLDCRKALSYSWRVRLLVEHSHAVSSYFVTLTYDPEHYNVALGVSKEDIQKFMKRLRNNLSFNLRFFLVSEYGDKHQRGHYHALFFCSKSCDSLTFVKALQASWQKGNTYLGTVTNASISYVTDYLLKGSEKQFDFQNDPFRLMSRKPAIGYQFSKVLRGDKLVNIEEVVNYFNQKGVELEMVLNGKSYFLPRYYRNAILSDTKKRELARRMVLDRNKIRKAESQMSGETLYYRRCKQIDYELQNSKRK